MPKLRACASCGGPCWSVKFGTCNPCRVSAHMRECVGCGATFRQTFGGATPTGSRFCSRTCANRASGRAKSGGAPKTHDELRAAREKVPGLGREARRRLLRKWQREGRRCAYGCGRPAETVDHVVPLKRGGTNYEGNLAPACMSCNSSKGSRLLVEWLAAA